MNTVFAFFVVNSDQNTSVLRHFFDVYKIQNDDVSKEFEPTPFSEFYIFNSN